MPHLYQPWKHGEPLEHTTLSPTQEVERRASRDARAVQLAGVAVIMLGVMVGWALELMMVGFVLFLLGWAMVILDSGLLLVFASLAWAIYSVIRVLLRASRRGLTAIRR